MKNIECTSIKGGKISIPREKLIFRPSVYGIVIHDGKILMLRNKSNGKLFFPGGGVNIGERMTDALHRELEEETGIEIEIGDFLHFQEIFFYWDPGNEAYHMFTFFYRCEPKTFILKKDELINDEESEKPRWIDLTELKNMPDKIEVVQEILDLLDFKTN